MKKLKTTLSLIAIYIIDKKYRAFINLELRCDYVQWQDENRVHKAMIADWFGHVEKIEENLRQVSQSCIEAENNLNIASLNLYDTVKYFDKPLMY